MNRRKRAPVRWMVIALLGVLIGCIVTIASDAASAQSTRSVVWRSYDVTIDVQQDGTYRVTEVMEVEFSGAPAFTFGFAEIPTTRVESIENVSVAEDLGVLSDPFEQVRAEPVAGQFRVTDESDLKYVRYVFSPTTNRTRTFILSYTATGALRAYPDASPPSEQIYWIAIDKAVTEIARVERASVTVHLPEAIDPASVILGEDTPGPANERTTDGQTWSWSASDLTIGEDFVIRMEFPAIAGVAAPSWQAADDRAFADAQRDERRRTQLGVIALILGLITLPAGGFWLTREYRNHGRDPHVGLIAETLETPPDDLPGGLVGVLVDEKVATRDMVAALIGLANRGEIVIEQRDKDDFDLQRTGGTGQASSHEDVLLAALFSGKHNQRISMKEARKEITKKSSDIREAMYRDLVEQGYFERSPESVRNRWIVTGVLLFGAGVAVAAFLAGSRVVGLAAIILGAVAIILGAAVFLLAQVMPRKTLKGAELAAKWRAFERYLREIEKFEQQSPLARDPLLYERYLPYATAFGIEKQWTERFARAGAPAPRWFIPMGGNSGSWSDDSGGGSGGGFNIPSPQGMSNSAMMSLASASAGMASFLNSASTAFTPPSSSGGSGGGGFSGGGGGGGGGGRGFG